jgi:hypothetical protein
VEALKTEIRGSLVTSDWETWLFVATFSKLLELLLSRL